MKRVKDKKGFTLVELIVVLVILGILAAFLVPALLGYIDRSKKSKYILAANYASKAATAAYVDMYSETGRNFTVMRMSYSSNGPRYRSYNTFKFDDDDNNKDGKDSTNGMKYVNYFNQYFDDNEIGMHLTGADIWTHSVFKFNKGQIADGTIFYFRDLDWNQGSGSKYVKAELKSGSWEISFH